MIQIVVEGQPHSGNELEVKKGWRKVASGGVMAYPKIMKSEQAKAYTDMVAVLAGDARRKANWDWSGKPLVLEYYFAVGNDIDCDNIMKLANDGIAVGLRVNDKNFLPRAMCKHVGVKSPRVIIRITEAGECTHA